MSQCGGITERDGVQYYAVDITPVRGNPWRVMRRYNDFDNLRTRPSIQTDGGQCVHNHRRYGLWVYLCTHVASIDSNTRDYFAEKRYEFVWELVCKKPNPVKPWLTKQHLV